MTLEQRVREIEDKAGNAIQRWNEYGEDGWRDLVQDIWEIAKEALKECEETK